MFRFYTSGESHGKGLTAFIEGLPAGLKIDVRRDIDPHLAMRQQGHGRGGRMKIEQDRAEFLSGVRFGETLGGPVAIWIENKDWANWEKAMSAAAARIDRTQGRARRVTEPRPGHADLAGLLKYGRDDIRDILERASARETAARVAAGAACGKLLAEFGVDVLAHVVRIGSAGEEGREAKGARARARTARGSSMDLLKRLRKKAEASPTRCLDAALEKRMMEAIDQAKEGRDTVGGEIEILTTPLPVGLGSYAQWDRRLDGALAQRLMSVPAIKGVEIGLGFGVARTPGSRVHDEIFIDAEGAARGGRFYFRKTNNAGGFEGGMTNGEPLVARVAMKPIPTLMKPLRSIDLATRSPHRALVERSDVCAVPAAAVVAEAMTKICLAEAAIEKFGGDSLAEMKRNYRGYMKSIE